MLYMLYRFSIFSDVGDSLLLDPIKTPQLSHRVYVTFLKKNSRRPIGQDVQQQKSVASDVYFIDLRHSLDHNLLLFI